MRLFVSFVGVLGLFAASVLAAPSPKIQWLPRSIDPATIQVEKPPHLRGQDLAFKALKFQNWLRPRELLVVVGKGAGARAYPLRLLAAFRVVADRDEVGPFVVSYCVPCAWIRVFRLPEGMEEGAFSGLWSGHGLAIGEDKTPASLDPLFYDPDGGSLFSHKLGRGVTGPLEGEPLREMSYRFARVRSLENDDDFEDLPVLGPFGDSLYFLDSSIHPNLTMDLFDGPHLLLKGANFFDEKAIRQKAVGPGEDTLATVVDGETFREELRNQPKPKALRRYPGMDAAEPVLAFWLGKEPVAVPLMMLRRREGEALVIKRNEHRISLWTDLDGLSWQVKVDGEEVKSWPMRLGAWAFGKDRLWLPLVEQDS